MLIFKQKACFIYSSNTYKKMSCKKIGIGSVGGSSAYKSKVVGLNPGTPVECLKVEK